MYRCPPCARSCAGALQTSFHMNPFFEMRKQRCTETKSMVQGQPIPEVAAATELASLPLAWCPQGLTPWHLGIVAEHSGLGGKRPSSQAQLCP